MKSIIDIIPPMLSGDKLKTNLTVLPEYHENIRSQNAATRLMRLSDLYKIYLPSNMSTEIYSKLYLALIHSLQKKLTKASLPAGRTKKYDSFILRFLQILCRY